MPDPVTKQPEIRRKLAEYLTVNTTQFYSDIDWLYYQQAHDSSMSPRGAIFTDRISETNNYPGNLDAIQTCYKIHIRLKITKDTFLELLDSLDNWAAHLKNQTFRELQCDGYDGYFQGIHLDPKQESVIEVNKNQDDGGTGNLHLFYVWDDNSAISGSTFGKFL